MLNLKLDIVESEQGPGMGGAMLAMVADGTYGSVKEVCGRLVHIVDTIEPDPELVTRYEERYQKFRKIYPAMKGLFTELLQ